MPIGCQDLKQRIAEFSLVAGCDILRDGITLRIATPFKYPDGSLIDVFLQQQVSLTGDGESLFKGYILSDFGQTARFLLDLHIDMLATKKRRQIVAEVCRVLGVEEMGSQATIRFEEGDLGRLPEMIVRVAQACVRLADLAFLQRFPVSTPFRDDVEEFIDRVGLPYESEAMIPGRFGREVPVDFRVQGRHVTSLVKTLSTKNTATAHTLMNETLACWVDLSLYREGSQLVTVLDDRSGVYRQADVDRLASFSTLIGFPSGQEQLQLVLAA